VQQADKTADAQRAALWEVDSFPRPAEYKQDLYQVCTEEQFAPVRVVDQYPAEEALPV
jgi:hypothetical protein